MTMFLILYLPWQCLVLCMLLLGRLIYPSSTYLCISVSHVLKISELFIVIPATPSTTKLFSVCGVLKILGRQRDGETPVGCIVDQRLSRNDNVARTGARGGWRPWVSVPSHRYNINSHQQVVASAQPPHVRRVGINRLEMRSLRHSSNPRRCLNRNKPRQRLARNGSSLWGRRTRQGRKLEAQSG